jgi:hypothetical protein
MYIARLDDAHACLPSPVSNAGSQSYVCRFLCHYRSFLLANTVYFLFPNEILMKRHQLLHSNLLDMEVRALPFLSDNTCKSTTDCTYFGYTGIPATDPIIAELTGFFAASEPQTVIPKFYQDEAAINAAYDASPVNFVVGVVFLGPSTNLSTPSTATGSPSDMYQYTILANHTASVFNNYLDTRFATAQVHGKKRNNCQNIRDNACGLLDSSLSFHPLSFLLGLY